MCHGLGLRDHDHVRAVDLGDRRAGPLRHRADDVGPGRPVAGGDDGPGRPVLPRRRARSARRTRARRRVAAWLRSARPAGRRDRPRRRRGPSPGRWRTPSPIRRPRSGTAGGRAHCSGRCPSKPPRLRRASRPPRGRRLPRRRGRRRSSHSVAAFVITAPPYEWPTATTGPSICARTMRVGRVGSDSTQRVRRRRRPVTPSACSRSITPFQLRAVGERAVHEHDGRRVGGVGCVGHLCLPSISTASKSGAHALRCARSRSPQRPERRAHLVREQLRLLPGGEVAAAVELVVVDEVVRIGALGPAARGLVELVGEDADGERDRDVLGVEEVRLVLPVQASRGDPGVGQPVERDVVEDVVAREVARQAARRGPARSGRAGRCRRRGRARTPRDRWASRPVRTASADAST